ncbi:MAG: hypothetical protein LUC33_02820, partial [Prevotellaceae bacterium]|nr:hypothetical protein [Prevotellaceae bacterium]
MKRFLFLCLAALTLQAPCLAYDAYVDGFYYNLDTIANTAEVTYENYSSSDYSGDVVIPSTLEYDGTAYAVTSIGDWAF